MKRARLQDMLGGWFVGDFEPTLLRSRACEVAVKHYLSGAKEARHVHKVAQELTLITKGRARMNDQLLESGDMLVLEPGEASDFEALEDVTTVVVKLPSAPGDKYPA